jgi:glycopeptide antibiotics resistance protein
MAPRQWLEDSRVVYLYTGWARALGPADLLLAGLLTAAVVAAMLVAARRGAARPRLLCAGLLGGYLVLFAVVVLCPLPVDRMSEPVPPAISVNLHADLRGVLRNWSLDNQALMNVLLTMPFGFGLPFVLRRGAWWLVAACLALPVAAEGLQLLISLSVPRHYRSFDVEDLLTNLAGGLAGLAAFAVVRWLAWTVRPWPGRDPRRHLGAYLALAARRFRPAGDGAARRRSGPAALAAGLAVAAAALLGVVVEPPGPPFPPDACSGAPAGPVPLPGGITASGDRGALCLSGPDGSSSVSAPGEGTELSTDPDGTVTVVGSVRAARVRVTLTDGRSAGAAAQPVTGLPGWSVYAVVLPGPTTGDVAVARVQSYDAAGEPVGG